MKRKIRAFTISQIRQFKNYFLNAESLESVTGETVYKSYLKDRKAGTINNEIDFYTYIEEGYSLYIYLG